MNSTEPSGGPGGGVMSVEKLARVLVASAKDQEYASFNGAPMARSILADPAPLLAALAEAGVLAESERMICSCGSPSGDVWTPHVPNHADDHVIHKHSRYVTKWRPTA